jgi:hypothetical protein
MSGSPHSKCGWIEKLNEETRKAGNRKMPLEHEALPEKIIGAAIEVHRRLGPGILEAVYEKALIIELKKRGMAVQDQMEVIITYDGHDVGRHRLDLFVFAVVRSQLRAVDRRHGLLLNFAKPTLEPKRVIAP